MTNKTISVAITGSGGSGAVTTGLILLEAMAQSGYYGFMSRSAGPQIRGGESAVMLRFSEQPIFSPDDRFDVLLSLDWHKVERFSEEIPLDSNSLIIGDSAAGEVPEILASSGAVAEMLEFKQIAKTINGGRANMIGLGVLATLIGISSDTMLSALKSILGKKGDEVIQTSNDCIKQGMEITLTASAHLSLKWSSVRNKLWNISGNEACGVGALRAGIRFVAAYPITPASDILEWMAPNLEKVGGSLLQAEDELASINMIIGSSFGGVPSMTATSGPGLSLMMEGLGLAVASETPLVVVNVMRGGPSTGIPTKSEQSDLNLALYGFHGDAPHLVLAPLNIGDCVFTTQWAVCLSEQMQAVALVLSDQSFGQSRVIMKPPESFSLQCQRKTAETVDESFQRYQLTEDGISPMSIPGQAEGMYTADGLEHNQRGTPSSIAGDHQSQMEKRLHKITRYEYGDQWSVIEGEGDIAIITWGSSSAVCFEAASRLAELNLHVKVIAVRLLMPLNSTALSSALKGCSTVYIVEQNHSGQFYHYLQAEQVLPENSFSHARPGPLPIRPNEIVELITGAKS